MPTDMVDIIELPHSWLIAEPVDCLRGACHVIAKKHAIELYDLNENELLGLMKEVQIYAWALKTVTGAVKINYEIHGNSAPHLHMHLYPRYIDDPFPGRAIDYHQKIEQYAPGEFQSFVQWMNEMIQTVQTG
jgi:diadenosine tetraphosphate (Ap4A) HIT family hydrolase